MSEVYSQSMPTKYNYKSNEDANQMFIFEIILTKNNQKTKTIRKIKRNFSGKLINPDDKINYSDVESIQINMYDVNNPSNILDITVILNHVSNYTIFNNSIIYLEFYSNMEFLETKYNLFK
jgi:hypothetical protein